MKDIIIKIINFNFYYLNKLRITKIKIIINVLIINYFSFQAYVAHPDVDPERVKPEFPLFFLQKQVIDEFTLVNELTVIW